MTEIHQKLKFRVNQYLPKRDYFRRRFWGFCLETVCELILPERVKIFSLEEFLETGASFSKILQVEEALPGEKNAPTPGEINSRTVS